MNWTSKAFKNFEGAAIDDGSGQPVAETEIAERVERLACRLREICPSGRAVAVDLPHGLASCLTDLALLAARLPALPLPSFFMREQRHHAIRHAGAAALITADAHDTDDIAIERLDTSPVPLPDGTAKISFTSGSTGTPKGICLSARHMIGVAQSVVDHVGRHHAGRHLALLPPAILLENVAGFYATMLGGGTYVALPSPLTGLADPFLPDFPQMVDMIAGQKITSLILVPEYLAGIAAVLERTGARLPLLTLIAVGGARVPLPLLERGARLGLPVRQGYGLTECGSVVTLEMEGEKQRGSAGQPLGGRRIGIAADGEIIIHGETFLGTVGEERVSGAMATGDIGRIDENGRLWVEGRKKNLIITSHGRNISPEWVESQLLGQPGIIQAMVYGDGDASLSALIVSDRADAAIVEAVAAANAGLPAYAHVTNWRRVAPFTPGNGLITGNGRLRRDAITRKHLAGETHLSFFERLQAETAEAQMRFAMTPQLRAGLAGNISRDTYVAYLEQAYHHVRHTVPLLRETLARVRNRPELIAALEEYIEEETGHERWILSDIGFAGGDPEAAEASTPNAATQAMVDHAYDVVRNGNPVGFFGMVYVLEGTSVALASRGAAAVAQRLGLPPQAFTYLTSHGALDREHMKGLARLLNGLRDSSDQQAVIDMANAMFDLFGGVLASIPMEALDAAA